MVKVKLFGTLQLDTGIKEIEVNADSIQGIYAPLFDEIEKAGNRASLSLKDLKACIVAVNGKITNRHAKLHDGDEVYVMTAVAGG